MRLDRFLSVMGVGTRSQTKNIIQKGRVLVNGITITNADYKLSLRDDRLLDEVICNGRTLSYTKYEYYMLNKPSGVVSATTDPINRTVINLIESDKIDLFPVGRLDKDTEGLLLITNDGDMAHKLLSPKKHIPKTYYAKINKPLNDMHVKAFAEGVTIKDKSRNNELVKLKPSILEIINQGQEFEVNVTIYEGKYHQIKRMFQAIDREVLYLKRLSMGNLFLDNDLKLGQYRPLTSEEIEELGVNMLKEI